MAPAPSTSGRTREPATTVASASESEAATLMVARRAACDSSRCTSGEARRSPRTPQAHHTRCGTPASRAAVSERTAALGVAPITTSGRMRLSRAIHWRRARTSLRALASRRMGSTITLARGNTEAATGSPTTTSTCQPSAARWSTWPEITERAERAVTAKRTRGMGDKVGGCGRQARKARGVSRCAGAGRGRGVGVRR